jgi:hypothetical protein
MLHSQMAPIHTVSIHGIPYAEIYQLPQAVSQPLDADFGPDIHLRGYDLDTSALRSSHAITLTLGWQARDTAPQDYTLFIHVLDATGNHIGQADVPPGGPRDPTSTWRAKQFVRGVHHVPVWGDTTHGPLWIAIGLYDPRTGERLPLRGAPQPQAPSAGPNALLIGPFQP